MVTNIGLYGADFSRYKEANPESLLWRWIIEENEIYRYKSQTEIGVDIVETIEEKCYIGFDTQRKCQGRYDQRRRGN